MKMFYFEIIDIFCMRQQNQSRLCNWQSLSVAIFSFHQGSLKSQVEASVFINPPILRSRVSVGQIVFQLALSFSNLNTKYLRFYTSCIISIQILQELHFQFLIERRQIFVFNLLQCPCNICIFSFSRHSAPS